MFVGHATLAFALAALLVHRYGRDRLAALAPRGPDRRAVVAGAVAGLFALLPDIDMVYAPVGLFSDPSSLLGAADAFWAASTVTHRALTHSLVVSALVVLVVWAWARGGRWRVGAVLGSLGIVALPLLTGEGIVDAVLVTLYVVGAVVLATVASARGLSPRLLAALAAIGTLSHPFGDVFTGAPPAFLYPFDITLLAERVLLSPDPTVHLLGAMGVELAALWLGTLVYAHVTNIRVRERVGGWAAGGVAFAGTTLVLPPPTLDLSYPFVFSVLGFGLVLAGPRLVTRDRFGAGVTFLAAVTVAAIAYTVSYLVL